jgi:hypothetical protein
MRTIASSGTLTDTIIPGQTFEVMYCIQMFDPEFKTDLAKVDYVLSNDGQDLPDGQYDLRDGVVGDLFHLRKTPSGWEVDAGRTVALNHPTTRS